VKAILPAIFAGFFVCASCSRADSRATSKESTVEGVSKMAAAIARDLHTEGPNAWLRYFGRSPGFFMASDGAIAFPNNDSATVFVNALAKSTKRIELQWGTLRIDSLAPGVAQLAAPFDEVLTDTAGRDAKFSGYFTGVAVRGDSGWTLRNAHWSLTHAKSQ
jgi:hypothetical protein